MVAERDLDDRKTDQGQWKENEQVKTQADRQVGGQVGRQVDRQVGGQVGRQAVRQAEKQLRVQEAVRVNEMKVRQEGQEEPGWFHICSQGLEGVDLFPDDNAFIVGVNKFATAFKLFDEDVEVVILVLVSTHFHSLAWGRRSDVARCAERFKRTISMYYSHRFGTSKVMCRVRVKVEKVDSEEYLKNVIGYILNNPRKHRETNNPFSYPWSSILEYFDKDGHSTVMRPRIVDIPPWRKSKIIGTNRQVPDTWKLFANGMVTFNSFISTDRLESTVKTIGSLSYLVNKADLNANQGEAVRYPDNDREVRGVVAQICPILFPGSVARFDESELAPVRNTGYCLKEMRKTICSMAEDMLGKLDSNQIVRLREVLSCRYGFPLKIVDRVLHSYTP